MMTDAEKPFVCSSAGCNMSFSNEDQLTVHKKKHDMMLNLGNGVKNTSFVADQTPTPTRFIRNCEEVGLFQDLQNVNPFEETFRRAVESGNAGTLSIPEDGITDDTLHTPHIFPHIVDVLSVNGQILAETNVQECCTAIEITEKNENTTIDSEVRANVKLTGTDEQDLIKNVKLTVDKKETLAECIINHNAPTAVRILPKQTSQQLSSNGENVQLFLKTSDGKLMQLSAVPICETATVTNIQRTQQQTVLIKTEPPLLRCSEKIATKKTSTLSLAKLKLKQVLTKSTDSQNKKPIENFVKDELHDPKKENLGKATEQVKKRDILERNRASSMRARAKRKAWVENLEKKAASVSETNIALQMEVKALRSEVAKLKALLLVHKDCPVTRAMGKELTTPAPLNAFIKRSTSLSSTEVPIQSKKLCIAPSKNPIILPKVDCSTNNVLIPSTTLFNIPTIKIMDVNQLITDKDGTKQILFVQNSLHKLGGNSSRQIIQINPNYEVEQATQKSAEV